MIKNAEFEEVVKSRLFTSATPETIEIVGEFSILYGIFEDRLFRRPCGSKSGKIKGGGLIQGDVVIIDNDFNSRVVHAD